MTKRWSKNVIILPKMHKKKWVPMHFDEKQLMVDDLDHCQIYMLNINISKNWASN